MRALRVRMRARFGPCATFHASRSFRPRPQRQRAAPHSGWFPRGSRVGPLSHSLAPSPELVFCSGRWRTFRLQDASGWPGTSLDFWASSSGVGRTPCPHMEGGWAPLDVYFFSRPALISGDDKNQPAPQTRCFRRAYCRTGTAGNSPRQRHKPGHHLGNRWNRENSSFATIRRFGQP